MLLYSLHIHGREIISHLIYITSHQNVTEAAINAICLVQECRAISFFQIVQEVTQLLERLENAFKHNK